MRWSIWTAAAFVAATAAVQAQSQTPAAGPNVDRSGSTITVVGCLQNAVADGSLGGTPLGTSATPADAGVVANVQPPIDGYILAGARPAGRSVVGTSGSAPATDAPEKPELRTYALEGKADEFAPYKGQQVEVTGTVAPPVPSGRNQPPGSKTDAFQTGVQRLRVQTITKVADACEDVR